jgi:hypothetical protein
MELFFKKNRKLHLEVSKNWEKKNLDVGYLLDLLVCKNLNQNSLYFRLSKNDKYMYLSIVNSVSFKV